MTVYFSSLLSSQPEYAHDYARIVALLDGFGIAHGLLEATLDIWCRDYMPVPIGKGQYVQFRYEPGYLKDDENLRSEPFKVNQANGFAPAYSYINLDGGNVLRCGDRVIMTDRVFDENPAYRDKRKLIAELEALLQAEVWIMPQVNSDMTGHADGLLRWYDRDTVLITDPAVEFSYWQKGIFKFLGEHGLRHITVPAYIYKGPGSAMAAFGCYVNFLEVADVMLLPVFEMTGNKDDEMLRLFEQLYPNRRLATVNVNSIARRSGLLNCVSWVTVETVNSNK